MLLLRNARIMTMNAAMPRAEAAVIDGDRFVFVGTQTAANLWLGGREHTVIDAQGCTVTPGLNDAHLHFAHVDMQAGTAQLGGCDSVASVLAVLCEALAKRTDGWLVAEGWNQDRLRERRLLTRQDLDSVSVEVPIVAKRACGHILAANSAALAIAGLDVADGILRENEQEALAAHMPPVDMETVASAVANAQDMLLSKGITSIQSDDLALAPQGQEAAFLRLLQGLSDSGALKVRYAEQAMFTEIGGLRAFLAADGHKIAGNNFHVSCVKLLADGSLGARTAWMRRPYIDAPDTKGMAIYTDDALAAMVSEAVSHGMPVAIHAIGDAAMRQALDTIERFGGDGLRHGIVHAQVTDSAQVARCGRMGLCVLAQPIFLDADLPILQDRVGGVLAYTSYRWRGMLAAGANVAFSTDSPVEPIDPMPNLYCAMARRGLRHELVHAPEEAFTLDEAIYAYTAAGAYVTGEEAVKGRIQPGMLADFVIFDRLLDEKEPASLLETGVRETYIGGECVWG